MYSRKGKNSKSEGSDKDSSDGGKTITEGFQTMEVSEEEDFETITAVKRDKAFDYRLPIDDLGNLFSIRQRQL